MLKKVLSVLLAVMMVVSVMAVGVVTSDAATTDGFTPEATKFYFDVDGTGWEMGAKDKIAFYMMGGDFDTEANATSPKSWGTKALQGTATSGESGIWEFEPGKKGYTFTEGVQYKIVFAKVSNQSWVLQTCDLFFTDECLGHVAYCDGTEMENNVDSTKKSKTVYWRDMDPEVNGPVLCITSIGNVVGSCVEQGKTKFDLLVEFLSEPKADFQNKTCYENAHKYKCEIDPSAAGYKSEQQLIDDIGAGLGFTKDEVQAAFDEQAVKDYLETSGLGCSWSYDDSTLPTGGSAHEHTPGEPVIENDVPSTCKVAGTYDEVIYCTECGEEISRETKSHELADHTPGEAQIENDTPSTCKVAGTYDEVIYCTVCGDEISRETKNHELAEHTPGEPVQENIVPATCQQAGGYDTVTYCTVCGDELSRDHTDIGKLLHTPGEPVQENVVPADCENAGSYDSVVYCTECGEELSRDPMVIPADGHDDPLKFVEEVPATATKDGVKAHYECTKCGKKFSDETGLVEVTDEDLAIKAEHVRGDADGNGELEITDVTTIQYYLAELPVTDNWDAVAADADLDGEIDIIDVSLIQRVLANMTTFEKWDAKHAK